MGDLTARSRRARRVRALVACGLALVLALALSACVAETATDTAIAPTSTRPTEPAAPTTPPAPEATPPAPAAAPEPEPIDAALDVSLKRATITRVVDGDTVHVRLTDSGATEKVRIIGVDTPEYTKEIEPYGAEASAYAKKQLDGETVYLETDAELRDRYGRLLAYVWMSKPQVADSHGNPTFAEVKKRMFDAWLVRDGYASVMTIPPNVKYAEHFVRLQSEARDADRGLWGLPSGGAGGGSSGSAASAGGSSGGSSAGKSGSYIGNRNTMKLHYADCASVTQMNPANKVPYSNRDTAINAGYVPCKNCKP